MRTIRLSQVIHGKQVMMTAIMIAFVGATLWVAPATKAWSTFSVWYGNRTSNSVTIYWTVRGQEDSLSTPADVAHICWTTDPISYPCPSHETTTGQFVPVGTTMSYTINGLTCAAYRVMVGQPYVLSQTWDWDEHTIDVPASQCSNPTPPAPASGSLLWLRADAGLWVWEVGLKVLIWEDQSGHANNAVVENIARGPTLVLNALNGLPIIRFGGAQSFNLTTPVSPQTFTIFIVGKNSKPTETFSMILGPVGSSPNNQLRWENGSQALFIGNSNKLPLITTTIGNTRVYHELTASYNGSTMTVYRDGNLISSYSFATTGPWTLAQVGAWYATHFMEGDLAEVLIYASALSDANRTMTDAYLKGKYALR